MADLVILLASMGLNLFLVPTIRGPNKPQLITCVGFSCCVLAIGGALLSAGLWLGGASNVLGGLMWVVVSVQVARRNPIKGDKR